MVDFGKLNYLARIKRMPPPERFKYFVRERETARLIKEAGCLPPLCDDPIIAVNRFCNINREHDAVTKWIRVNVREKYANCFREWMVVQLLVARIWNHPPTLRAIMPVGKFADEQQETLKILANLRASGEKVMRGAYMMPVHGSAGAGRSADEYYMQAVAQAYKVRWDRMTTLGEVAEGLMKLTGIGEFLANQVCADLRHCRYWRSTPDRSTFVLCGPGTRRGIDRYDLGDIKPVPSRLGLGPQRNFVNRLLAIRQNLLDDYFFNTTFYDPNNLANCFCEWDKYERVLWGEVARLHSYP